MDIFAQLQETWRSFINIIFKNPLKLEEKENNNDFMLKKDLIDAETGDSRQ